MLLKYSPLVNCGPPKCTKTALFLSLGLRRRALGLFKTSTTTALVQKIAKENADADAVVKKVAEMEQAGGGRRTHSTGDSVSRLSR